MVEISMRSRMRAGAPYIADDPEIAADMERAQRLCWQINQADPTAGGELRLLFDQLLAQFGDGSEIRPPFHCDYGHRTRIGARTFANFGLVVLDVATVEIGDDVFIGPNVQLLTATHPLHPVTRLDKWESADPISIGNNVWLGGGVIVCPGVTIGDDAVIGAGSVVIKDVPSGVLVVGNPARVVRALNGEMT
ncbi:MAG: sugar O-acetyltransferase [Marmoricola sp.]